MENHEDIMMCNQTIYISTLYLCTPVVAFFR